MRPLISFSAKELQAHFEANMHDAEQLDVLIGELKHRGRFRAQRLMEKAQVRLAELKGDVRVSPSGKGPAATQSAVPSDFVDGTCQRALDGQPTRPLTSIGSAVCRLSQADLARYDALAATFSEEGQILARWGMTERMSRDLQDYIFSRLLDDLKISPDTWGRTSDDLERDQAALSALRNRRPPAEQRRHSGRRPKPRTNQRGRR